MSTRELAPERAGKSLWWLAPTLFFAAALTALLVPGVARQESLLARIWTLRFGAAGGLCLCLGIFVRNPMLKSLMFSLLAVFSALGAGEWYLTRQDSRHSTVGSVHMQQAQQTDVLFIPEFAEELLDRAAPPDYLDYAAAHLPMRYITDKDELARFKSATGANDPDAFMLYADEFTSDPVLGYRAVRKAARIAAVRLLGDYVVYDATYTLLPSGWRTVPQHPEATEAVVFFGCSFTFGEGLNDEQSYPFKAAEMLGPKYQVFNFGFHGYGSHQMLAMIENGYLDDIAEKYQRIHVFYMTISGHEQRSAGKSPWDRDGPAYEISGDGVIHTGTFREREEREGGNLPALARVGEQQRMENLHIAIMKQADRILREKYHSQLTVITWYKAPFGPRLRKEGVSVLDLTRLAAGEQYYIKHDGHPNALATALVAEKIAAFIEDDGSKTAK